MNGQYDHVLQHVRTCSSPSELRITDIKVCDIGAPQNTTLMRIMTNQGIEGLSQIRENGSRVYLQMLKRLLLGENPCDIDKLFRRLKQFGGHSHQGGGVSGVEVALWDLAGKAYGIPVWQMLGGKFRDKVRLYCDTDVYQTGKPQGKAMGEVMKKRIETSGYTIMKMDLTVEEILWDEPDAICCPVGFKEDGLDCWNPYRQYYGKVLKDDKLSQEEQLALYAKRRAECAKTAVPGPLQCVHITEHGLDVLEEYVKDVRSVLGYEVPIAMDHFGHIGTGDCIRLVNRLEKYGIAWMEDLVPWNMFDDLKEITQKTNVPIATGEDIYLKENFAPLLEQRAVNVIHPDLFSCGGILEAKKIGDMAQAHGIPMILHQNETPIAALACMQVGIATENFMAMEFHHHDYPWWSDLVICKNKPIIDKGFINISYEPGLGVECWNDEMLREHLHATNDQKNIWMDTDEWDDWYAADRLWL